MRAYRPRRQSKAWLDSDCPAGVLAIYDSGPNLFADRFTVFFTELIDGGNGEKWLGYRSMSESPCHPQGVGLYCEMRAHEAAAFRNRNSKRAATWSSLPEEVKKLIRRDLAQEEVTQ
jgi:hypothetical protein